MTSSRYPLTLTHYGTQLVSSWMKTRIYDRNIIYMDRKVQESLKVASTWMSDQLWILVVSLPQSNYLLQNFSQYHIVIINIQNGAKESKLQPSQLLPTTPCIIVAQGRHCNGGCVHAPKGTPNHSGLIMKKFISMSWQLQPFYFNSFCG